MKYWLLTTEYPPFYGGGISTYCYHTASMLAQNGHEVTVFIPDEEVKDYISTNNNTIRIIRFNLNRTNSDSFLGYVPRLSYEFAAILKEIIQQEGKPDCIESQEYLAVPYYLLQYKLLGYPEFENIPVIVTLHSPAFLYLLYNREGVYEFPNYWTGELEKSCIQSADHIISPSHYIIEEIKKHFDVDENRISVVRNPFVQESAATLEENIQKNKIVFFGKLSPQKGVFEMFTYFKDLWDNGFQHPLIVIGGTEKVYYPEMKTMGQVIEENYEPYIRKGLITFTGRIPPQKIKTYLSDAHIILIPSLNDNLPYAAIEAMSMGKVVLASSQGGQAEFIEDGINGFIFDHYTQGSFESKLKEILSMDKKNLYAIGEAARTKIMNCFHYEPVYSQKMLAMEKKALGAAKDIFPFTTSNTSHHNPSSLKHQRGLLSVVIPFYNLGAYLNECILSIQQSAFRTTEILIVNDGSTDHESLKILKQWENKPGIKVLHKKNEGLAESRNYGAKHATGEFLAFLDADDKVHPEYYRKAIKVLQQYKNVSFVGCWVKYFDRKQSTWPTWNPELPYILIHNTVNSSSLVYKTQAFIEGGLNDKKVDYGIEDYESVINMVKHGSRGVVLPECLFYYRIRKNSMYRHLTRHKILYSYEYISQKHARLYNRFSPQIFSLLNSNGPSFSFDNPSLSVSVKSKINYPNTISNQIKNTIKRQPALKKLILKIRNRLKKYNKL